MDVKIGIVDSPRELVINSGQSVEAVESAVRSALAGGADADALLSLKDEKGRTFLVQAQKISYVEIGPGDARKVGFSPG